MTHAALEARLLRHVAWGMALVMGLAPLAGAAQEPGELTHVTGTCNDASAQITAKSRETVEVVFPNGGSVTLAPGTSAEVSCTSQGGLALTVASGILRIASGPGSPPALVRTADSTVRLDDGAAVVDVDRDTTRVHLLTGSGLTVTSGGTERRLYRSGFEVVAVNGSLSRPRRMNAEEVVGDLRRINPGLATGLPPQSAAGASGTATRPVADAALEPVVEENRSRSGTPSQRSVGLPVDGRDETAPPPRPPVFADDVGSVDLAGGFGATTGTNIPINNELSSSVVDSNHPIRFQEAVSDNRDEGEPYPIEGLGRRTLGPTANSVYSKSSLTETIRRPTEIQSYGSSGAGLSYFSGTSVFGLRRPDTAAREDEQGLFLFGINRPVKDKDGTVVVGEIAAGSFLAASFHGYSTETAFGHFSETIASDRYTYELGQGALGRGLNYGSAVCVGAALAGCTSTRRSDNFFLLEIAPALAFRVTCNPGQECNDIDDATRDFALRQQTRLGADNFYYDAPFIGFGLVPDPSNHARLLFASGDLDGLVRRPAPGPSVDRFYLSAGMAGRIVSGVDSSLPIGMDRSSGAARAFARDETWTQLDARDRGFFLRGRDISDSGLLIINPRGPVLGSSSRTSKVLHADVALRHSGTAQVSTISATIGEVRFQYSNLDGGQQPSNEADAFLAARTIGSSRGLNENGRSTASTLIDGRVKSTAAGGGNPNPGFSAPGRLGFLVLENAGDVYVNGTRTETLPGGRERPVGRDAGAPDRSFALARLGVGVSSSAIPSRRGFSTNTIGYAAAFVETEVGSDVRLERLRRADSNPNLSFSGFSSARNEVSARMVWDGGTLTLGGAGGRSAYLDDERFGLRSSDAATSVAMVSGKLVQKGLAAAGPAPRDYDYVKWGFFFGDAKTGAAPRQNRQHIHLGSFAAGERLTAAQGLSVTNPVVTYRGHAVGNVRNGDRVYTRIGTFQDRFDFGRRQGTATLNIDGRRLTGQSAAPRNLQGYSGTVAGGGLTGSLNGRFVGPLVNKGAGRAPAGIVGNFGLSDSGTGYRATGTFASEQ